MWKGHIALNQTDLQALVESISLEFFQMPFQHQATFNNRLRTTGSRYLLASHHLEFNARVLELHGMDEFLAVIKHELCHYHLHLMGKGYKHADADFKHLLAKTGGTRYVKNLRTQNELEQTKLYLCQDCQQSYHRKRNIDTSRYVCGKCKGKLILSNK